MKTTTLAFLTSIFLTAAVFGTAFAQGWEPCDKYGGQILFERRDDEGLLYYQLRWVYDDGSIGHSPIRMKGDCKRRLLYEWDEEAERWGPPKSVGERDSDVSTNSTAGGAFLFVCKKYGQ